MTPIYFDYASTTPTDPAVLTVMEPYFFKHFANAASPHNLGRAANKALEDARSKLAQAIAAKPQEIVFNSGATEGNNHAIFGAYSALKEKGNHIILSAIEHHSVLEPVQYLQSQGASVTVIGVDPDGFVNPHDIKSAITDKTILIATILANNEIGTIQPVAEVGAIVKERGICFLVDAVQAVGHIPVNVNELHADLLTLSAHKFYGPKGIGALYIREDTRLDPLLYGGSQETSRRASTQNVAAAVGMAKAIEICLEDMEQEAETQTKMRDRLLTEVPQIIDGVKINGSLTNRLPNNVNFSFKGIESESLLMSLDMVDINASMGSACTAGAMEPSHVLKAIGLDDDYLHGALRVTLGRFTKEEHIDYFLQKLPSIVQSLRN